MKIIASFPVTRFTRTHLDHDRAASHGRRSCTTSAKRLHPGHSTP